MKNREIQKILEKGLGSKGRIRIIITLAKNPEGLSKYMLEKLTGIRSKSLSTDLLTLIDLGWVREETDHIKKYFLCFENEITKHLLEFLREIDIL